MPEHIGSTAVPRLAAKPVIDIMAPLQSLAESRAAIDNASLIGYVYYPYKAELMHWFSMPTAEHRTHHMHLVPLGSRMWSERLAFRDTLRADRNLRKQYQERKVALALLHRHDREASTDAKDPFVQTVVASFLQGCENAAYQDSRVH